MCGIAGLVDASESGSAGLERLAARLAHRGPDSHGFWRDPTSGVGLAHRRLAVVDLTPAGHQPMTSHSGRHVLTFNGEIYNHHELRVELERLGAAPAWRGHSDTEVLLAAVEHWGLRAALQRCNGMFAFALWDRVANELSLVRDRMGEKPLYYGWIEGRFAFASELKALLALRRTSPSMHAAAIAGFLDMGYVQGETSAVAGVHRLPPATSITLGLDALQAAQEPVNLDARQRRYWRLDEAARSGVASPFTRVEDAVDALAAMLDDAVALRMEADVPLGAFLSGGIDSSLVTALMQARATRPVRTFSIGFEDAALDEARHARAVAAHLRTDHTELHASAADALALVPGLAAGFDEPFADDSQMPTLLVSRLARRQVTVALTGDGGDELFAGYGRYFAILRLARLLWPLPEPVRRGIAPALEWAAGAAWRVRAGDWPHRLRRLATRLRANDIDALRASFIGGGRSPRRIGGAASAFRVAVPDEVHEPLQRLIYGDQADYLPDDILHKVDRASMAHALETRVPLLDHRVVELAWRMPCALLVHDGRGKQPLRRLLARHVPDALVDRPKQGFVPPTGAWLRGALRDWAADLLTPASLQALPMLDAARVEQAWREHLAGRDRAAALWRVLMLADWRRHTGATA